MQPRKPRQRGDRRAEDLDKTRYLGRSWLSEISRFFILQGDVFCGLRRVRSEFFRLGSFLCSYEYMKIRVRLMRTREDVNENRGVFRSRRGAARFAPARWGGGRIYSICFVCWESCVAFLRWCLCLLLRFRFVVKIAVLTVFILLLFCEEIEARLYFLREGKMLVAEYAGVNAVGLVVSLPPVVGFCG